MAKRKRVTFTAKIKGRRKKTRVTFLARKRKRRKYVIKGVNMSKKEFDAFNNRLKRYKVQKYTKHDVIEFLTRRK